MNLRAAARRRSPALTRRCDLFQAALGKPLRPVYLVAPGQIMRWLQQYHEQCQEVVQHFQYVGA